MRMGAYYFDQGRTSAMKDVRTRAADGLTHLLGPCHRTTLKARSGAAYAPLIEGDVKVARDAYVQIAHDQLLVSKGKPSLDYYNTLIFQGQAEYLMNDFSSAVTTLSTSSAGFLREKGGESNYYLSAHLWYSIVIAAQGKLDVAIQFMEAIRQKRHEQYGGLDGFANTVRIFLGDFYRRNGSREESIQHAEAGLDNRSQVKSFAHPAVIDTAVRLVIVYRHFGLASNATKLLDELLTRSDLGQHDKFVQRCQVNHLHALLLYEQGEVDKAISQLHDFLARLEPERTGRVTLCALLDLALMLRKRNAEGDDDLSHSLFDGLLVPFASAVQADEGGDHKPDSPRVLRLAEEALRIFRYQSGEKADALLKAEGMKWRRPRALWLPLGMPAADTTWMGPPGEVGKELA
ncbi:uncharacterized protein F5Z01DRAFT_662527 [Emericellopsis atlantica]|uniref:Uncharacterized protein n=1 Tax=Emericellopsis atlantica TaxID=2614577 RepID=A0A9P7ZI39_9HYPO|nr:uncharacterized protein F5Z01DRAFT_662527 [Emericellopsis atlantica]KAG9251975.1 hypothetical protein F5Z01DRAFT_662527 [Emericellopsis atlantica]